jgi:hypothetical protein
MAEDTWQMAILVCGVRHTNRLASSGFTPRSKWACRWIGVMLKRIGKIPRVIITDGLLSYGYLMDKAQAPKRKLQSTSSATSIINRE